MRARLTLRCLGSDFNSPLQVVDFNNKRGVAKGKSCEEAVRLLSKLANSGCTLQENAVTRYSWVPMVDPEELNADDDGLGDAGDAAAGN